MVDGQKGRTTTNNVVDYVKAVIEGGLVQMKKCPACGSPLVEGLDEEGYCESCDYGEDYGNRGEPISVHDAANIWRSRGKDEDYMFGYSQEELEDAF